MISLLVFALVLILVVGAIIWIVRMFPLPAPFGNIAVAIIALIGLIIFLSRALPLLGVGDLR